MFASQQNNSYAVNDQQIINGQAPNDELKTRYFNSLNHYFVQSKTHGTDNIEEIEKVAKKMESLIQSALAYQLDLFEITQIDLYLSHVEELYQIIDILIDCQ